MASSSSSPPHGLLEPGHVPAESEAPPANPGVAAEPPSDTADQGDEGNNAARALGKKPAWSKPSSVAIEAGPVMGAVSWPALSESARASVKPSLSSSEPPPSSPSPKISSSPKKPNSSNQNSNWKSHIAHSRQRSITRGSDGANSSNSSVSANGMPAPASEERSIAEPSPTDSMGKNKDHGFRAGGNEHSRDNGGWGRKGNNGSNGHHQNNSHVNRRDHDWNRRGMNGWDGHMQHQGSRPYPRPLVSVAAPPYMPPPLPIHGHPFPTQIVFPDVYSPLYYPPPDFSPMIVSPMPLYFPPPDPVRTALLKQIDYYFSSQNLCRDVYLRQNMDDQGWVPISLIAGFNRVKQLTDSIPYILDIVRYSAVVEMQGDKIRRRNDWMNWVLLPSNQFAAVSATLPQSPATQSQDSHFPAPEYGSGGWLRYQ